ncbi:hypothetical protein U1Q18_031758 [Sarracenia purpurea var. burkii]
MECNKDEALRAKVIAERKIMEKDFSGSKKFVLKAQTLYPGLGGLSQMLTTLDVHISAENKISGEPDWYGILGLSPYADDETVKRQYRRLALLLHPDKNKSVGADGAFKLLSEAWSLLSDKSKRLAYNQRSLRGSQQKVKIKSEGQSAPTNASGFRKFPNVKTQNNAAWVHPTSFRPPPYPRTDTFWTICHRCKMYYEYLRTYLDTAILCTNCHDAFLASETAPPLNFPKPSSSLPRQRHQNPVHYATNGNNPSDQGRCTGAAQNTKPGGSAFLNSINNFNSQQGQFARTAGVGPTFSSPSVAANVVQRVNEKLKKEVQETQAAGCWERPFRKRGLDGDVNGYGNYTAGHVAMGNGGTGMGSLFQSGFGFSGICPNSIRDLPQIEIRYMMMEKARVEIRNKLNEWTSASNAAYSKKQKLKESMKEKEKGRVKSCTSELNGNSVSCGTIGGDQTEKCFTSSSSADEHKEELAPVSMNVPDPDFHDFDNDRTESSFGDNQVWAAYDDDDGMPRYFAMIHKVISLNPFRMRISWLNSKTNSEFGTLNWVGSGFFKTCGEFRVGRPEFTESLNSFSHKVDWAKGPRGIVCIFPKKGDVWALYRNWSSDWNAHTPDEVIHKYDMVEVLEDYNEDQGVFVAPLIKVAGFRTVFRSNMDLKKVRRIPKEEMFQFSHRVPNYLLTGQEAQNSPKGCLELDPAAMPLELLQLISEVDKAKTEENDGKTEKVTLQNTLEIG